MKHARVRIQFFSCNNIDTQLRTLYYKSHNVIFYIAG